MSSTPARPPRRGRFLPAIPGRRRRSWRRGAAASEFALIAIPFFVLILAVMEAGWQLATGAALDHAALRASRYGMTGANTPPSRQTQNQGNNLPTCRSGNIRWMLSRATGGLIRNNSNLVVTTTNWSGVGASGSGSGTSGAGAGGQIVSYTVTFRQPFITGGLGRLLWGTDAFTHTAYLLVKNEPFENVPC